MEGLVLFSQFLVGGIATGLVYSLIGLGFVIIYKASKVINFAQGYFLMIGAYLGVALSAKVPFLVAVVLTFMAAIVLGFIIEKIVLRPMIGEPILSVVMATIGMASVIKSALLIVFGPEIRVFPPILKGEIIHVGRLPISSLMVYSFIAVGIFLLCFGVFYKWSRTGIAMRCLADDQLGAQASGVSVRKMYGISWAVAAFVAFGGGILVGNISGVSASLEPFGLKVFPAIILGGLESLTGVLIAGVILGVLESMTIGYLGFMMPVNIGSGVLRDVVPFIILIVILMVRPYGLFGLKEIEKV